MKNLERFREAERRLWLAAGLSPQERRVPLRSVETVRIQEVGEGEPVLFVHGAANAGHAPWIDELDLCAGRTQALAC